MPRPAWRTQDTFDPITSAASVALRWMDGRKRWIGAVLAVSLVATGLSVVMARMSAAETYWVPPGTNIAVYGRGFGHGRGMSQYGAQGHALAGHTSTQILDFYYPGTTTATAQGNMRVLITADTSPNVQVYAASGLKARDLGTNGVWTLPVSTDIAQWWLGPAGDQQTRLMYYSRAQRKWVPWRTLTGMGQFEGPVVTRLVLPDNRTVSYRGILRAVDRPGADVDTVNIVGLESYLRGVVPRESIASWRPAALEAQAVAARTYAVSKRTSASTAGRDYDICDTTACQVYGGYGSEVASTNSAVVATANKIRTYAGTPILAEYSSSNGGYTAAGPVPYQVAKADPYDGRAGNGNPYASWTTSVDRATAEARFGVGTIKAITVSKRNGFGAWGGRVVSVDVVGSDATKTFTGDNVRSLLGLKADWYRFDQSAIITRWVAIGGANSPVGGAVGGAGGYEEPVRGGTAQTFAKGTIYWSSTAGAWEVYGDILTRYRAIGGPDHPLGLPIAAPANAAKPGATVQRFRGGRMFWSAATSVREVSGRIYTAYYSTGLERSRLGLPTSYQTASSSGAQQTFEGGQITWDSATNTTTVSYRLPPSEPGPDIDVKIGIPRFSDMLVDPGRGRVYITGGTGVDDLVVTDLDGNIVRAIPDVAPGLAGMTLSPDGTKLYVAASDSDGIVVVDTETYAIGWHWTGNNIGTWTCPRDVAFAAGQLWFSWGCQPGSPAGIGRVDPRTGAFDLNLAETDSRIAAPPLLAAVASQPNMLIAGETSVSPALLFRFEATATKLYQRAIRRSEGGSVRQLAITPDGDQVIIPTGAPYYHAAFRTSDLVKVHEYPTTYYPNAAAIRSDGLVATGTRHNKTDVYVFEPGGSTPIATYDFGHLPGQDTWTHNLVDGGLAWNGNRIYAITDDGSDPNNVTLRIRSLP